MYGDEDTFKIVSDETGGALTIMETTVPPGGGTPLHIHHRESEGIYVLDGELEIVDNGLTIPIRTGSFVFMPEGSIHSFTNTREEDTSKVLILFIPGGFEQCLIEMGTPVVAGQPPPPSRSDEDIAKAKRIGPKYGLEIVDPGPSTGGATPA